MLLYQSLHDLAGHAFNKPPSPSKAASPRPVEGSPPHDGTVAPPSPKEVTFSQTFAAQAQQCRAFFPAQREVVERLLAPTESYIKSSKAATLIDLDESATRQQQEEEDLDGVADEEAIQILQMARLKVTHGLGQQWKGLRDFMERPLSDLRSGISLPVETAEYMQGVGYGVLESLHLHSYVGRANGPKKSARAA